MTGQTAANPLAAARPSLSPWAGLSEGLRGSAAAPLAEPLLELALQAGNAIRHGDMPRWAAALQDLRAWPGLKASAVLGDGIPRLGDLHGSDAALGDTLKAFHPWRKGPLCLAGITIDTEWRSDWKWQRIAPHIDLQGHRVLDVGCGNGYYGWRMLGAGAECVLGIDPTVVFLMQWLACKTLSGPAHHYVLPLKDTDLPQHGGGFDSVFSMGVLYHRRDPADHLRRLLSWTRPGGQVVLETLVLDQPGLAVLKPGARYARMRNVWEIPTPEHLQQQMSAAGFKDLQLLDVTPTSVQEQRSTPWMHFESLAQSLDPVDTARTIEGHPAPVRAVILGRRP